MQRSDGHFMSHTFSAGQLQILEIRQNLRIRVGAGTETGKVSELLASHRAGERKGGSQGCLDRIKISGRRRTQRSGFNIHGFLCEVSAKFSICAGQAKKVNRSQLKHTAHIQYLAKEKQLDF